MTDWQEFVASLVASLAWPVVVIVALLILRKPIVDLVERIRHFEGLGFHAKLDGHLSAAERSSSEQEVAASSQPDRRLAERVAGDPIGTIVHAWQVLESAVDSFAEAEGLESRDGWHNPRQIVTDLYRDGRIQKATVSTVNELAAIRNAVVHARGELPSEDQAAQFAELVDGVVRAIDYQREHILAHGRGNDSGDPRES